MKGINERMVRRVADRAEEAWKRGGWISFWGRSWTSSNPVDAWHNLSAWKPGEQPRIVAVYQRDEAGGIVNLEVLA